MLSAASTEIKHSGQQVKREVVRKMKILIGLGLSIEGYLERDKAKDLSWYPD